MTVPPPAAPPPSSAPLRCGTCGASSSGGRFCAECGAPFDGAVCAGCRSALTAGARFCHRCGTAVGAAPPTDRPQSNTLPWAVTSICLVALVALIAGRNFRLGMGGQTGGATTEQPAPATGPTADDPSAAEGSSAPDGAGDAVRAPDISALSPRERADRLYDRVMRLSEQGKTDSVEFFAPMVMAAYQMMGPLDADAHYDLGRIGVVTGVNSLAKAEADTILRSNPTHLLGLALAARAASTERPPSAARGYYRRLVAAAPAELKKNLPEYARHRNDIEAALSEAKRH